MKNEESSMNHIKKITAAFDYGILSMQQHPRFLQHIKNWVMTRIEHIKVLF